MSEDLGKPMTGINCDELKVRFAEREGGNMPTTNGKEDKQVIKGSNY